jgi:uncharacterized phage protein gp47/JayE
MAFQIRDFRSIVAGCINWMKSTTTKINDYNVGSVARTIIEAPAAEMDELYQNILIGLKEAIPVSVYTTFGFDRIPAEAASGVVRFSTGGPLATAPIVIQLGTVVRISATTTPYATLAAGTIQIGQSYVDILVSAQSAGVSGNCDAGAIDELVSSITGINSVTNPSPLINGRDEETDDQRRTRFRGYISTLARGTKTAVEYGAKTAKLVDANGLITEYVAHASVIEPYVTDSTQPISLVDVYVHNGASATSTELVAEAQRVVDGYYDDAGKAVPGWKAAGVKCVVSAASDKAITVTGNLTVQTGYVEADAIAAATNAVKAYIQGLGVGETVVLAELIAIIKRDIVGVYNITLSAPLADVTCAINEKAIPGTVTLT